MPAHEPETLLNNLLAEIRSASARIDERDSATKSRLAGLEHSVNDLMRRQGRPSGGNGFDPDVDERKSAIGLLEQKHFASVTKADPALPAPSWGSEQIAEATLAIRGLRSLMHSTSIDQVPLDQRKALSQFSLGSSGFLLSPEMSDTILSCLVDVADIAGLMNNVNVSGAGIKFMVDNEIWDVAAWACESSCFANNPTKNLGDGLGELEIKPESLRYIVCTTRELLEDSSVNIETWLLDKARRAFAHQINNAVLTGDGFGKPLGILSPNAGIPIAETSDATPAGTFTWQDIVMLRWQVPMSLQGDGAYLMNQHTWALCSTMSDAAGRPIMTVAPTQAAPFLLAGAPVVIANQMPDVAPGATPIIFGNWKQAYTVVNRRGVTMQHDPYSAGFCTLIKFDARVGGAATCPNAARLLRIR